MHFTDIAVRSLKPNGRTTYYWDDSLAGFGIRVGKRKKTWTVIRGANRERLTIGHYGDGGLSLAEARAEAKVLLAAKPESKVEPISFSKAKEEFLTENYRDGSPRTHFEASRLLTKHFKNLHTSPLHTLTDADIKRCLDKIHAPSERLHAYRVARCFLKWCTRPPRKYIKHSPMEGYEPPGTDKKGTRVLSDQELKAVWQASKLPSLAIFRLLILWGTRSTETTLLRRDFAPQGVMTIPGQFTKNGRAHSIPILPLAQTILDSAAGGTYYFPARWDNSGHLSNGAWNKLKLEVQELSGTKNWQVRDLRRTFRSNMARLKVPRDICELLLNHAPPVLDEIYDRYDRLEEKRDALERYEHFLIALLARD